MTVNEAIDRFLLAKRSENSSPCTIRAYRADLVELASFIGIQQGPDRLSREIVRGFLAVLYRRGATKTTSARKLSAIKSFARWLRGEGILPDDNFERISIIKRPKTPEILPDVPSPEEVKLLLDGGEFPTAFPARDHLLLELMYGCGLRVSEATQIQIEGLRPEQKGILISGKGGPYGKNARHRIVPLNPNLQRVLETYLLNRQRVIESAKLHTTALVFAARDRYAGSNGRALNQRSVHRMLLHICKVRGLSPMHPHLLRHACATHMLDNGCPLDVISQLLGHDNLDVTAHYAQVSTRLMLTAYNGAHPHGRRCAEMQAGVEQVRHPRLV